MLHIDNLITVAASVTPGWHQAPDTSALVRPHLSRITVLWGRGVRVLVKSPGRKLVFGQVELCGNFKTIWLRVVPPPHLHIIYNKVCIWAWRSEDNFLLLILVYHLVLSQGCSCFSHVVSFRLSSLHASTQFCLCSISPYIWWRWGDRCIPPPWTQVTRLGGKHFYPLSHLTSPTLK